MKKLIAWFLLLISIIVGESGVISGSITDNATQQPLPGVNVIVEGTMLGAASDEDGYFHIIGIPIGFYHVRFSAIGYEPLVKLNIRVVTNRPAIIKAELEQQTIELEGITITREYFEKEKDALVSSRTVDLNEIRRDPVGAIDIQRMMQALPAVVSASDQQNEIVVRGGSPGENLFLMDNIEISNPNHFGQPGTGGGPINMINTLFIDRVDFMAGAFPAKYGDKASSVMEISLREGSRLTHSQDVDMSMAGIGLNVEGPLFAGRGSYLASFRKSYLELIIASTGLTAVPRYWSMQSKLTYDVTSIDKLMFNFVHGVDAINLEGEDDAWSRGAENVDASGNQSAYGLSYKRLWGKKGLTDITIGGTRAEFIYDVYRINNDGEKAYYADQNFTEWDFQAKGDFLWKPNPKFEISGGVDWKQLGVIHDSWVGQDTVWLYGYSTAEYPRTYRVMSADQWRTEVQPIIETADPDSIYEDNAGIWHYSSRNDDNTWSKIRFKKLGMVGQPYDSSESNTSSSHPRLGAFVQVKYRLSDRIYANIGLRAGYLEYTDFKWFSPRIGVNYAFTPLTSLSLAYGRHYQSPNLLYLAFDSDNKTLNSKYNDQVVLGIEHLFSVDTRGTFEAYWKEYQDIPVDYASTTLDSSDVSSRLVNKGHAKSYGIEFFLQKKMAKDLFGTFSYSWYRAFMQDPRVDVEKFYPQTFDFQHVVSIVGGYRIPLQGANIVPVSKRSGLIRFIAKALGWGADELELSVRYRYVGGKPYTPLQYDHNVQRWYEDPDADYNTERLIAYHRFDLMILWHSHFKNFNVISYFDLQNVFNRENIWDNQYNADGTTSDIYQYQVMPVGGFTIEF
ncbi:MAG: TonB-dependent receptor [Candidatus Marinimicrobia bacterium]|nr:TonB-dependent receptor [Candidatus Neomarinimicrobiota bacterium]